MKDERPPCASLPHVHNWRERQRELGRYRKEYYVTDEEHIFLSRQLRARRRKEENKSNKKASK
jgi:hypothetical protein